MMPFNYLGFLFNRFASKAYPPAAKDDLVWALSWLKPGSRVLDLGAGTAILSRFVMEARKDLGMVALDPAPGMLRYVPGYVKPIVGRAERLPFCPKSFGAVTAGDALHHFAGPEQALREVYRVLEPDGVFFIFEINPEKAMGRIARAAERTLREPARFYAPRDLAFMLREEGFIPVIRDYDWRYAIEARKAA